LKVAEPKVQNVGEEPKADKFPDYEEYRTKLSEYTERQKDYEIAQAFGAAKEQDKDGQAIEHTYAELTAKVRKRYDDIHKARERLHNFLKKLWSATSGGKYAEGEETVTAFKHKQAIEAAFTEIAKFHAKYEHEPLIRIAEELQGNITKAEAMLAASGKESADLKRQMEVLKELLHDFEDTSPKRLQTYLEDKTLMEQVKKLKDGATELPPFFVNMVAELAADPAHTRRGTIGYEATKEASLNKNVNAFRDSMIGILNEQLRNLKHQQADLGPRIKAERQAVEDAREKRKAWGRKDQQVQAEEGKDGPKLKAELFRLENIYDQAIDASLESTAAQNAVDDFVRHLDPESL
jgi:hypothetical protein